MNADMGEFSSSSEIRWIKFVKSSNFSCSIGIQNSFPGPNIGVGFEISFNKFYWFGFILNGLEVAAMHICAYDTILFENVLKTGFLVVSG